MVSIGTPLAKNATRLLLLGSGELGKEFVIEAQRLGIEVIAVDRYENAPAMQVAHRSYVINMLDGERLKEVVFKEQPDFIVPEIEAIATDTLLQLEQDGFNVIPSAKATQLTMNREGIRRLAAEKLEVPTSPYRFADSYKDCCQAIKEIGLPCVIKPIMSSSGKGQSLVKTQDDIDSAWQYAQDGGRAGSGRVIIEGFVDFDYEITLLTISYNGGIKFCAPIGHIQKEGDYRESWQPQPMTDSALNLAQTIAKKITLELGGYGLFGVEFFIKGDDVVFSEISPRPHDTGMVTLVSQGLSEFALHLRAILGLPITNIRQNGPAASHVILANGESQKIQFLNLEQALELPDTTLRLFGKPELAGKRRLGVALAIAGDIETARQKARKVAEAVEVQLN